MSTTQYKLLLGLVAAAAPLATDMYLPAIPQLASSWGTSVGTVNLSLVLWFVAYAISLLVCGSLSDRFGRRPILLVGLALFGGTSLLCAFTLNVYQLIGARILQGFSAAGGPSMAMAIARDRFEGKERQNVLAWIAIILGLAPMLAPSIGSAILEFGNWRYVFVLQGSIALASLLLTWRFLDETATQLVSANFRQMLARYGVLLSNHKYLVTTGGTSLLTAPVLGFVAFSPIAYILHYGMSERTFALLFGFNASFAILGSLCCAQLVKSVNDKRLLRAAIFGSILSGGLLTLLGSWHWSIFAIGMASYTFCFGLSRPLVNHLVLEQVDRDFGIASSGLICTQFLCGAIGMALATASWGQPFLAFGILTLLCPLISRILTLGRF